MNDANEAQRRINLSALGENDPHYVPTDIYRVWLGEVFDARKFSEPVFDFDVAECECCGRRTTSPAMLLRPYREQAIHNAVLVCQDCKYKYFSGNVKLPPPRPSADADWGARFPTVPGTRRYEQTFNNEEP